MRKRTLTIHFKGWKGFLVLAALGTITLANPGFVRAEKPCFLDGWVHWVAEMQTGEEVSTSCRANDRCCKFACTAKSDCCETACQTKAGCGETACRAKADCCEAACRAKCGTCETSCVKSKPVFAVRVLQARVDPCDHCPCAPERPSGVYPVNQKDIHFRLATVVQQANHRAMMQNMELHQVIKDQNQQIQKLSQNMESLMREIQNLQQQVQMLRNQPPLFVPPPPPPVSYPQMPIPYYAPTAPIQYVPSSYQAPNVAVPPPAQMVPTSYPGFNYLVPAPAPQPYPLPPQPAVPPAVPVTSTTDPMLLQENSNDDIIKLHSRPWISQRN